MKAAQKEPLSAAEKEIYLAEKMGQRKAAALVDSMVDHLALMTALRLAE